MPMRLAWDARRSRRPPARLIMARHPRQLCALRREGRASSIMSTMGANIAGFVKVADATMAQGTY
jgi:hypothetical protein